MKRLTMRLNDGRAVMRCEECKEGRNGVAGEGCTAMYCRNMCKDRLAAYEDTGLEPERCAEFARADAEGRYIVMRDAEQEGVARLRELAKADKDGRLVMLPCKVGEKLWVIGRDNVPREMALEAPDIRTVCADEDNLCMLICSRKLDGFCAYRLRNDGTDIGKTVFLTRKEAEKALGEANEK